jgi:hypothetical protein
MIYDAAVINSTVQTHFRFLEMFMRDLHEVHKSKDYWEGVGWGGLASVRLFVSMFHLKEHSTDFVEIWYCAEGCFH